MTTSSDVIAVSIFFSLNIYSNLKFLLALFTTELDCKKETIFSVVIFLHVNKSLQELNSLKM